MKQALSLIFCFPNRAVQTTPNLKSLIEVLAYNQEEKLALLSVAHRFNFSKIFRYIIKEINADQLSVLNRIRLGDKYELNDWLLSAYKQLINRSPTMDWSKEEAEVLGLERVNKLFQAKNLMLHEELRKANSYKISVDSYREHLSECRTCRSQCRWKRSDFICFDENTMTLTRL